MSTIYRLIMPAWAKQEFPDKPKVLEGEFSEEQLEKFNTDFYNIYYLPNSPSVYEKGVIVDGSHIDQFDWIFVDFDLKEGKFSSKDDFIASVGEKFLPPTSVVDSGNGVHVYWRVTDLDAMSFLRLQRRLLRHLNTDVAVCKIYQLMRVPDTLNTKDPTDLKLCETILSNNQAIYTCERFDKALPPISHEDEQYCQQHYNKTYNLNRDTIKVDNQIPVKFLRLVRENKEARDIWAGGSDDRSAADYRLGHIMFASGFSKADAMSVLVNSPKALSRAPMHQIAYAEGIVDKIWIYELEALESISMSVADILKKGGNTLKGTRFPCHRLLDATEYGFRLGHVVGLVAGSGVGKTAMALNMFKWFVERNPEYIHFFIPLEQPANEIADRWRTLCGDNTNLHEKVHVVSNYAPDGTFRHLSFDEIRDYLVKFQEDKKVKIGCVVIDHIGALKKKGKDGENQDLMDICHQMKGFAVKTNTLLVMQSQAPREKAGIGDLELNKDAAYGTVYFESYCDYLVTIWQPLKRCYYEEACPTVTAYKFCKIRHKKMGKDDIKEDVCYRLFFDPKMEELRELTQIEETSFDFYNTQATNSRKLDRKTDLVPYKSTTWSTEDGKTDSNQNSS